MKSAFFGRPFDAVVAGGTHITVYMVPVFEGRLAVFHVAAPEARGRWLPWDVLEWGANPYVTASALADQWCDVPLIDLALVDVMSFPINTGGWELAIIFRAQLSAAPKGDSVRTPYVFPEGTFDSIGNFQPVDLQRWVTGVGSKPLSPAKPADPKPAGPQLLF